MNISIVCGGTGSSNIQKGLYKINKYIVPNIILNAYDDGKSTGIVRNKCNILGPSDIRKNQLLRHRLLYGDTSLYNFLTIRINKINNIKTEQLIISEINMITDISKDDKQILSNFIQKYLNMCNKNEKLSDFSIANMIYAMAFVEYGIEKGIDLMSNLLKIENNIYLNSCDNLFLKGVTKQKKILEDEESIVSYNNSNDKIDYVYLINNKNEKVIPLLDDKTKNIIMNSNIIILSCGTQFSSLIPTYMTDGFKDTLQKTKGKIYLILNSQYDMDIKGYSGNELLTKLSNYLDFDKINIITCNDSDPNLIPNNIMHKNIMISNGLYDDGKHNGEKIWKYIFSDYYNKLLFYSTYVLDYDYTLYDPKYIDLNDENMKILKKLKNIINIIILTNNCFKYINIPIKDIEIYSNHGVIKYINNKKQCILTDNILNNNDIYSIQNVLSYLKLLSFKNIIIENRNSISVSIKPIINRENVLAKINHYFRKHNITNILVKNTGKTTIEFIKNNVNKNLGIENILEKHNNLIYISDKVDVKKTNDFAFYKINNIIETNILLKIINWNIKYDAVIVAGGLNNRMGINYPKTLLKITNNQSVIENNINCLLPYVKNIHICTNKLYYKHFEKLKGNNIFIHSFKSLYDDKICPNGNGETLFQLLKLKNVNLTKHLIILWSDVIINNNKILGELISKKNISDFVIPVQKEKTPYAYIIDNGKNIVKNIGYNKINPIDRGLHDMSIFIINKVSIKKYLKLLIDNKLICKKYTTQEFNLLEIINYMFNNKNPAKYYITNYPTDSYNNFVEFNAILNKKISSLTQIF